MTNSTNHWDRRQVLRAAAMAGAAGVMGLQAEYAEAEPPPETVRLRVSQSPAICFAPQYFAGEQLFKTEGFTDVSYTAHCNENFSPTLEKACCKRSAVATRLESNDTRMKNCNVAGSPNCALSTILHSCSSRKLVTAATIPIRSGPESVRIKRCIAVKGLGTQTTKFTLPRIFHRFSSIRQRDWLYSPYQPDG